MTYVYQCRHCGERFEAEQRMMESPLTEHIRGQNVLCGPVFRVIQPASIQFVGGGWHCKDYGK